ncbi:MAG: hypothetical protein JOZ97_04940 [Candidatus Eremiobacteraeota bacterium]|nr:hypothetical protein [Candidatus Eremiobacteraeota bacterium]
MAVTATKVTPPSGCVIVVVSSAGGSVNVTVQIGNGGVHRGDATPAPQPPKPPVPLPPTPQPLPSTPPKPGPPNPKPPGNPPPKPFAALLDQVIAILEFGPDVDVIVAN